LASYQEPWFSVGLLQTLRTALKIHLSNLRIHCDFSVDHGPTDGRFFLSLPTQALVTLKLLPPEDAWPDSRHTWVSQFRNVICSSPNLETLHVRSGPTNSYNFFTGRHNEKVPPVRELCIEGDWLCPPHRVARHWDFSKLSVLKLWHIELHAFVTSVPLEQLSTLTKFEFLFKDRLTDPHTDSQATSIDHLIRIIGTIRQLEELVLECYHPHKLFAALEAHKSSLRALKLRDLSVDPQATLEDVETLRILCPYLKELELDIKVAGGQG
jgi:hypothetical protein